MSRIVHKKRLLTRLTAGAVVVAVTAGSALLVNGVANAERPAGTLGFNTISPASGTDTTPMSSMTSAACPSQTVTSDLTIVGPIGADPATATFPPDNPFPVQTIDNIQVSTTGPFVQQFRLILREAAAQRSKTIQPGEYDLTTHCMDEFGLETFGTFAAGINFDTPTHYTVLSNASPSPTPGPSESPSPPPTSTPVPTPTESPVPTPTPVPSPTPGPSESPSPTPVPTSTPAPEVTATTITLNAIRIPLPFRLGGFVIPLANVAPGNAVGTVQFKDRGTNLGGRVPIIAGFVFGGFFALPGGSHSLTAKFIPDDPAAFQASTSNTVRFRF